MVYVSKESSFEIHQRLMEVMHLVELEVFEKPYAFHEYPLDDFNIRANPQALALVRDSQVWSQLEPALEDDKETFYICCFHFPPNMDNSGFVGWLANHLKNKFGTGVFVVCGQNSSKGGIFDYWGIPVTYAEQVFAEIRQLTGREALK